MESTLTLWRERIRAVPHYLDRIAAGQMAGCSSMLSRGEATLIDRRSAEIAALRRQRGDHKVIAPKKVAAGWHPLRRYRRGVLWALRGPRLSYCVTESISARPEMWCSLKSRPAALRDYLGCRQLTRKLRIVRDWHRRWSLRWTGRGWSSEYTLIFSRRPNRDQVARAIRRSRAARAFPNARLDDGGLAGLRLLRVDSAGILYSPQRGTPWGGPSLVAREWEDDTDCRGHGGVHAIWAIRAQDVLPHLEAIADRIIHYDGCAPPKEERAYAIVGGYGRYVAGTDGWRAEQQVLQQLIVPAAVLRVVASRYPDVPVVATP